MVLTPAAVPVIVVILAVRVGVVVIVKLVVRLPAGTVTVAGTWPSTLLIESETVRPPVGAGPVRAMVPVALKPPVVIPELRPML